MMFMLDKMGEKKKKGGEQTHTSITAYFDMCT